MKYFLNWSNHPSSNWSSEQLDAVRPFGAVLDIPFPNIRPEDNLATVDRLAQEEVAKITEAYPNREDIVIHIQGEMTFLYRALLILERLGYRAVASTTERLVTVRPDGEKVVRFVFSGFRDYFLR